MMLNKRGEVAVGVMVIVTLLLFTFLLVQINVNASNVRDSFTIVYSYGDVYTEQESIQNSMYFVLFKSFLNNYKVVLDENSQKIGFEAVNLNDKFREKLSADLAAFSNYQGKNIFELFLKEKKPYITFDGERAKIIIDKWSTEKVIREGDNVYFNTSYSSALSSEVLFKRLELPSFDNIDGIYNDCTKMATEEFVEICFIANFQRFDVKFDYAAQRPGESLAVPEIDPANDVKEYTIATFTSKDKYLIDNQMQNIVFKLVFNYNKNSIQ